MSAVKWDRSDEQVLADLLARKAEFDRVHRTVLRDAMRRALSIAPGSHIADKDVERFISHAASLRDALEPFDSGVRNAERIELDPVITDGEGRVMAPPAPVSRCATMLPRKAKASVQCILLPGHWGQCQPPAGAGEVWRCDKPGTVLGAHCSREHGHTGPCL